VVVGNIDMQSGNQLTVGFDPLTQQLNLSVNGIQDPTISLAFARIEGTDIQIFATDNLQLGPNGTAMANLLNWNGQSTFPLSVDGNGDGTFEGTSSLTNLPLSGLIEQGNTSIEIISHLAEFSPYLNETERDEFTEKLLEMGLNGSELGKVFFAFDLFGMSMSELAQYLLQLGSMYDVALFLAELHLSPEQLHELFNGMPFDWQFYLSAQLAILEQIQEAYYEGTFDGLTGEELNNYIDNFLTTGIIPLPTLGITPTLPPFPFYPNWAPLGDPSIPPPVIPFLFD
jgi:hypothetical protein